MKLEGVVTMVSWTNPHMRVYIDVKDKDGKVTNWNMELTSPNTIRRQGWGPDDLKAGDKVIFEGLRREGRREPWLAADDHEGQRHEAAVRAGRS